MQSQKVNIKSATNEMVKFRQEISLLTQFVTLCDDSLDVQILYIGVTLLKCKRFLKNLFIQLKLEENIPLIMK
ncbi:hypothetical protein PVNG_00252 [Plasmodium vivax North Korean]|uniref:Uncharacterized protein n=1 Tax=Plasmodium vivax North Korean TaxID=1035514 RepID=A0A0J9TN56_PLAVI|nr:hypothetical protein PVNG_00252 [Plasmodium vivax North Korean]